MFNEKENDNINIIENHIEKRIELGENSYLLLNILDFGFLLFLNINDQIQTLYSGKDLIIRHFKTIYGEREEFYVLHIKDGYRETDHSIHIDENIFQTLCNCLNEDKLKYSWYNDYELEEYVCKIQEKTEKEDQ